MLVTEYMESTLYRELMRVGERQSPDIVKIKKRVLYRIAQGIVYLHSHSPPIALDSLTVHTVVCHEGFRKAKISALNCFWSEGEKDMKRYVEM